jgi:hypothetical protein
MKAIRVMVVCVGVALPAVSLAQSPIQVSYCQALTKTYRQAVTDGKSLADPSGVGEAIANCPTNPVGSIPKLEGALKEMKVQLPPR